MPESRISFGLVVEVQLLVACLHELVILEDGTTCSNYSSLYGFVWVFLKSILKAIGDAALFGCALLGVGWVGKGSNCPSKDTLETPRISN